MVAYGINAKTRPKGFFYDPMWGVAKIGDGLQVGV
jgi:hypothetical protein